MRRSEPPPSPLGLPVPAFFRERSNSDPLASQSDSRASVLGFKSIIQRGSLLPQELPSTPIYGAPLIHQPPFWEETLTPGPHEQEFGFEWAPVDDNEAVTLANERPVSQSTLPDATQELLIRTIDEFLAEQVAPVPQVEPVPKPTTLAQPEEVEKQPTFREDGKRRESEPSPSKKARRGCFVLQCIVCSEARLNASFNVEKQWISTMYGEPPTGRLSKDTIHCFFANPFSSGRISGGAPEDVDLAKSTQVEGAIPLSPFENLL
ncbi:hypothetical protein P7C70_g2486, partial [Phenoliferia sp. Uapishka_3]